MLAILNTGSEYLFAFLGASGLICFAAVGLGLLAYRSTTQTSRRYPAHFQRERSAPEQRCDFTAAYRDHLNSRWDRERNELRRACR